MNCDIIIPVWNELEATRRCLDSIFKNTALEFRIIIIDNGSEPPAGDYLLKLKKEKQNIILIKNEQNLGFVKATNQGLKITTADYICLLNNDTVVSASWLENIIKIINLSKEIGIANPQSNDLGQGLKGLSIDDYAKKIKDDLTYIEVDYCKGFCMVMKKEVLGKVGLLDENFGRGGFEETDFCRRAWQLGYKRIRVNNAYVWHQSKTSFNRLTKESLNELFIKNRDYYYEKWGKPKRYAYVIFDRVIKKTTYEITLNLARDWHLVYLFIDKSANYKPDIINSNIKLFRYPNFLFIFLVLFKILHRKKKRFDIIVTDRSWFAKLLIKLTSEQYFDIKYI